MCRFVWLSPGFLPGAFLSVLFPPHATIYFRLVVELNLYQPGIIDATVPFPSNWNELTLDELHHISKTILSNFESTHKANVSLFLGLLSLRVNGKALDIRNNKVTDIESQLDAEQIVIDGLPAIDFILNNNELTNQPYTILKIPYGFGNSQSHTMVGPADNFNNLTCGEFEDAEIFFNQFKVEPNEQALAQLAAILYRPKNTEYLHFDSKSANYVSYDAEPMVPLFKKLPSWKLYTIFLWYAGCRQQLPLLFPNCFGGTATGDSSAPVDFLIFTKCIHAGAGPKNGSRNEIRRTMIKEFFMEMELEKLAAIELQNKYDAAK